MITNPKPESETPEVERFTKLANATLFEVECAAIKGIAHPAAVLHQGKEYELAQALREAATALSLAQTEIKGHMRVEDEMKAQLTAWQEHGKTYGFICGRFECDEAGKYHIFQNESSEFDKAQTRIAELEKDAERLTWLEDHHTLHTQVDILYIVDGYQVTLMHEDGFTTLSPAYEGHDLRSAIDAALKARA